MMKWKSSKWLLKSTWLLRLLGKMNTLMAGFLGGIAIICLYFSLFPSPEVLAELEVTHLDIILGTFAFAISALGAYFVSRNIWYRLADVVEALALDELDSKKMLRNLEVLPMLFLYSYALDLFDWLTSFYGEETVRVATQSVASSDYHAVSILRSSDGLGLLLPNFHGLTSLIMALLFYTLYKVLSERQQMHATVRAIEEEHKLVI